MYSTMKVLLDTKKIQKLGRIVLSDALLRNAGLQVGDPVEIYFDAVSKHIIIQKTEVPSKRDSESPAKAAQERSKR